MKVGIDLWGGEESEDLLLQAVLQCQERLDSHIQLVVIGLEQPKADIAFIKADSFVRMDESPFYAVRKKKDSSMGRGVEALLKGDIDALVTTGNTGALVAFATIYLSMLSDIHRPALLAMLPTERGKVSVLDVGANIAFKSHHLIDYARLGMSFAKSFHDIEKPKIGLLNIGEEAKKGTEEIKATYNKLQSLFPDQFLGNIEGREVFEGKVDVLITDAFTGNVFLKTCEGASSFLLHYLQTHSSFPTKHLLNQFSQTFDYAKHPGALLAGVNRLIIKCHGYSNSEALQSGIDGAIAMLKKDLINKMQQHL